MNLTHNFNTSTTNAPLFSQASKWWRYLVAITIISVVTATIILKSKIVPVLSLQLELNRATMIQVTLANVWEKVDQLGKLIIAILSSNKNFAPTPQTICVVILVNALVDNEVICRTLSGLKEDNTHLLARQFMRKQVFFLQPGEPVHSRTCLSMVKSAEDATIVMKL